MRKREENEKGLWRNGGCAWRRGNGRERERESCVWVCEGEKMREKEREVIHGGGERKVGGTTKPKSVFEFHNMRGSFTRST